MPTDLTTHIANFKKWLKTDPEASKWQKDRDDRLAWYGKYLSKSAIEELSPEEFATFIKGLWATNIWTNKDYKVEQLIKDNGFKTLRLSLSVLLHGSTPIEKRWDEFRASVKGLGPSSISEILTFSDPQHYPLVNLKPYEVLPLIGMSLNTVVDGKSYKKAIEELGQIKLVLSQNGVLEADFILTDFFIAYLFYQVFNLQGKRKQAVPGKPTQTIKIPAPAAASFAEDLEIGTHEGAQAVLLMLGRLLDFDTYTADPSKQHKGQKLGDLATLAELPYFAPAKAMESARRVDVVWVSKEEWPECFFEVEQSTGVTPGLHRMFQVIKVDAKFFIVAPEDERKRFGREMDKAPYKEFKQKYRFRSYGELRDMYLACVRYRKEKDQFLR